MKKTPKQETFVSWNTTVSGTGLWKLVGTMTSTNGISDAYYDLSTNTWHKLGTQVMPKKTTKERISEGSSIIDAINKRKNEELIRIRSLPSAEDLLSRDIVDTKEYFVLSQAIQTDSRAWNLWVIFHWNLQLPETLAKEMLSQGYRIGRWAELEKGWNSWLYLSWEGDIDIVLSSYDARARILGSLETYPNRDKWSTWQLDLNKTPF